MEFLFLCQVIEQLLTPFIFSLSAETAVEVKRLGFQHHSKLNNIFQAARPRLKMIEDLLPVKAALKRFSGQLFTICCSGKLRLQFRR